MKSPWNVLICGLLAAAVLSGCASRSERLRNKGIAEFQVGRVDEARSLLKQSLDLDPADAETLYYMGRTMDADEFHEQAVFYYQSCLQVRPSHPAAAEWLGKAMSALGSSGETLKFIPSTQPVKDDSAVSKP